MQITLNGVLQEVPDGATVSQLLLTFEIQGRLAVEVNGKIVLRSEYETHLLHPSDRVEVVRAIGGG